MRALEPAFGNVPLVRTGDAIATARELPGELSNKWESRTYLGIVLAKPARMDDGRWQVLTDSGIFPFTVTTTLAIWFDR